MARQGLRFERSLALPFAPSPRAHPGRRGALVAVGAMASLGLGFALVQLSPLVVAGAVAALLGALTILFHPFLGLLLYLLMFILRPGEMLPILSTLHLERIIGIVTLAAIFLLGIRRRGEVVLDASAQTRSLLLFIGAVVLSIPFSYWRGGAVSTLMEIVKIFSLYIMVVYLLDTPRKLRVFVWAYLVFVLYLDAASLVNYYTGRGAFAQGIDRATGANSAGGNANELGTTLACAFPLLLLLALLKTALWRRLIAGGFALASLWGMVLTGSRASLLGFLGGLAYLWWRSGRRLLFGAIGVLAIVAGYFLIPPQYQGRYHTIGSSELDASSRSRVTVWKVGLEMVVDRPVFGVGAGCFGAAHAVGYSPESKPSWLNSHSLYIQVLAELGIVGAIAFAMFAYQFLRLNRRTARRLNGLGHAWAVERAIIDGLFAGFVVLFVSGIFGHSLYRRTWYLYAGLGLALWRILQDPHIVQVALPLDAPKGREETSAGGP